MVQSHMTATGRKGLSAPMRRLREAGLLEGRVLDFGCGRGQDADALGIQGYDPHWRTEKPEGRYDVVTCNYVLNVLRLRKEREMVVQEILGLLEQGGVAYFTVRRDIKGCYRTPKGWQVNVKAVAGAESLWKTAGYETFVIGRDPKTSSTGR